MPLTRESLCATFFFFSPIIFGPLPVSYTYRFIEQIELKFMLNLFGGVAGGSVRGGDREPSGGRKEKEGEER